VLKVKVKGHVIRALLYWHENRFLRIIGIRGIIHYSRQVCNLLFLAFQYSSLGGSKTAGEVCYLRLPCCVEIVTSARRYCDHASLLVGSFVCLLHSLWFLKNYKSDFKKNLARMFSTSQSYEASPATWDHTVKLCHINHPVHIICPKYPPSAETHAGWSHLIWHNFVTVGDNWIKMCSLA